MISVVSAYYQKEEMTVDFLDNLTDKLPKDCEVILVNAGSRPIDHPLITRRIDLPANHSFANSMNTGIKAASGDLVCVLGNDVFPLNADWLPTLAQAHADTNAFIVSPLNDRVNVGIHDASQQDGLLFVSMAPATCWLMSRECINRVGLFDEQFEPGCYEDNDYCIRVGLIGGKIAVHPGVTVKHLLSQTLDLLDAPRAMTVNYDRFIAKWPDYA